MFSHYEDEPIFFSSIPGFGSIVFTVHMRKLSLKGSKVPQIPQQLVREATLEPRSSELSPLHFRMVMEARKAKRKKGWPEICGDLQQRLGSRTPTVSCCTPQHCVFALPFTAQLEILNLLLPAQQGGWTRAELTRKETL